MPIFLMEHGVAFTDHEPIGPHQCLWSMVTATPNLRYIPRCRATPLFGYYQIILLGDRGKCMQQVAQVQIQLQASLHSC